MTIAYAVNSLCGLENADSYLNIFLEVQRYSLSWPMLSKPKTIDWFLTTIKTYLFGYTKCKKAGLIKNTTQRKEYIR